MGKKKLVFNLSLKDLKDLGIIKTKRKKRKGSKKKKVINNPYNNDNVKSISSHMPPYAFMNMNNLQAENLRLQNTALEEKAKQPKKTESTELVVSQQQPQLDRYQALEDQLNEQKLRTDNYFNQGKMYIQDLYSNYASSFSNPKKFSTRDTNFSQPTSQSMDDTNVLRSDTFTDNVDVGATGGDDMFGNAYGISQDALKQDEIQQQIKSKAEDGEGKAGGGGEGQSDGGNIEDVYSTKSDSFEEDKPTTTEEAKPAAVAEEEPPNPPDKKLNKYFKKIQIPALITRKKTRESIQTRKEAYVNLMTSSGQKPDKTILSTGDLTRITNELKKKFPDYYAQNIAKKNKI